MRRLAILWFALPAALGAQVRFVPDPRPPRSVDWELGGARMMPHAPVAAQPDSVGLLPLGSVGDPVTIFLFPNGHTLASAVHATITGRRRFDPPESWRAACDNIAHPGWMFDLRPGPTAAFTVVVPGSLPKPMIRPVTPAMKTTAFASFLTMADSSWMHYSTSVAPVTERAAAMLWWDFFGDSADAGWRKIKLFGVQGPGGSNLAVFSFWLHDDYKDGTHNTTGTLDRQRLRAQGGELSRQRRHLRHRQHQGRRRRRHIEWVDPVERFGVALPDRVRRGTVPRAQGDDAAEGIAAVARQLVLRTTLTGMPPFVVRRISSSRIPVCPSSIRSSLNIVSRHSGRRARSTRPRVA